MRLDDCLGHGKTEPKPLVVHRGGIPTAAETLENAIELLGRDADAAIGDAHGDLAIDAADIDFHRSLGLGVAHGIVKQHQEQLPEPCRIAAHHLMLVGAGESDVDSLGVGDHARVAAHFLDEIAEVDRLEVEARGAGALAGDEQEIVDQHREMLRLLDDPLDRALVLGDPLIGAAQRDLAFAANDGERRAQLVADVGEKAAPRLVDLAQGFVRLTQLLSALGDDRFEIGVGVLEGLLLALQILRHVIEAVAEIGEFVVAGDGDAISEVTLGEFGRAA